MPVFLGVVLLIAGAAMLASAFRRREPVPAEEGAAPAAGSSRTNLWGGVACLVIGGLLALWPTLALARMEPEDLGRQDKWGSNPEMGKDAPVRWDGNALLVDLEAGSGRYAVYPVDWEADRFEASWDITFTALDLPGQELPLTLGGKKTPYQRNRQDFGSLTVGLMDQNIANIDDRDHVSGSAIEACFSDDIRLRASDVNYIVRTSSSTESGKLEIDPNWKKGEPVPIKLGTKYHCRLSYDRRSGDATLEVTDDTGGRVSRRLEDLKDFTNSVTWFGVSVRGYNRFNKKLDPKKGDNGYTRPHAAARIENIRYAQP